jgi:hypothetical protein
LLVGAAVRTADAIDRVQGREQDEHRGGDEPSHLSIMLRFWTTVEVPMIAAHSAVQRRRTIERNPGLDSPCLADKGVQRYVSAEVHVGRAIDLAHAAGAER